MKTILRRPFKASFLSVREGESDYSALVMGFIRSIEARTGTGIQRRGYQRDDRSASSGSGR